MKLFDSSKDKNHLFKRLANSVNTHSQDLNKSKDSIQIPHESIITPVPPDKSLRRVEHVDNSTKRITRQIIYKNMSSRNVVKKNDGYTATEILSIYREILENSKNMEWDNFQELVEDLHPEQKEIWRNICRIISEKAKRERAGDADSNIEVSIEISPVNPEENMKTSEIKTCTREIVFEVDMTLKDVESFLRKELYPTDECLDTYKDGHNDVTSCSKSKQESNSNQKSTRYIPVMSKYVPISYQF
ncbi:hypothetical protein X777_11601 [Ooceraea biroi]|uniref:Uncharacterized protein n=2 Tax=Ooceraea biroi TaxID=2015173 RepID=A0A026W3V9_OOCBI|nr:hypothetical protein X777_11601 [Ooceraea biroi]